MAKNDLQAKIRPNKAKSNICKKIEHRKKNIRSFFSKDRVYEYESEEYHIGVTLIPKKG